MRTRSAAPAALAAQINPNTGWVDGGPGAMAVTMATGATLLDNQTIETRGSAHGGLGGGAFSAAIGILAGFGGMGNSSSIGTASGNSSVLVIDAAVGGNGGSISDSGVGFGDGGSGGIAASYATGSNTGNQLVDARSSATGGSGGAGFGIGSIGGAGAAISRTNEIDATGLSISLTQNATGGAGGDDTGGFAGIAGAATSSLIRSKDITFYAQDVGATGGAVGGATPATALPVTGPQAVRPQWRRTWGERSVVCHCHRRHGRIRRCDRLGRRQWRSRRHRNGDGHGLNASR